MTALGLEEDYGLRRGDRAWCLHCDREIDVSAVLDNPEGDLCPTPGCDGAGWGVDLDAEPWWHDDTQGQAARDRGWEKFLEEMAGKSGPEA
jgi:hypothetical protein